jgi:hypothetical protein
VILGSGMVSTIYNNRNVVGKRAAIEESGDPIAAET